MQDDLDERQKEEWLKELIDREARRINMKQIMEEQMDKYFHNKKTSEINDKVAKQNFASQHVDSIIEKHTFMTRKHDIRS